MMLTRCFCLQNGSITFAVAIVEQGQVLQWGGPTQRCYEAVIDFANNHWLDNEDLAEADFTSDDLMDTDEDGTDTEEDFTDTE